MNRALSIIGVLIVASVAASGQTASISDTLTAAVGGGAWTGRIIVTLNAPGNAQPLYQGTTSLAGWSQILCVGVTGRDCTSETAAGAVSVTLYRTDTISPAGTSYAARFQPTAGPAWAETWVVSDGDTKLYQIRATTVPTPTVMVQPSQITQAAATTGQCLKWSGTAWVPGTCGGGAAGLTWEELDGITWSELQ
jgi:hypothetical protein